MHPIVFSCQRCVYRISKKSRWRNCNKLVGLTSLVKKTMKNQVVLVLPWSSFVMILSLAKQLSPSPLTPPQALRFLYRSERETRIRPFPLFSFLESRFAFATDSSTGAFFAQRRPRNANDNSPISFILFLDHVTGHVTIHVC